MNFNYSEYKEGQNIYPQKLNNKEQYYSDLMNIEHSWTGRLDAMFSHTFFLEAVQLIINAIVLFEKGYFDCSFYSLRQSLEISTTVVYFADDSDDNRKKEFKKWQQQDRFPMNNQMISELQKRANIFAEIKDKMSLYFSEIDDIKQKLNKYVHKQGFDKFYISPVTKTSKEATTIKICSDFEKYLIKTIGAIAVFRLAIDPFPLLLMDERIYNRTNQELTEGYSEVFVENYIGLTHIEDYKKTSLYIGLYEHFNEEEERLPSVLNVIKDDYIDTNKIDEIRSQKHLLGLNEKIAVELVANFKKIAKVYFIGGLHWYFTNVESKRNRMSWSSADFDDFKSRSVRSNIIYDEAFITCMNYADEECFIEHNEVFSEIELNELDNLISKITKE